MAEPTTAEAARHEWEQLPDEPNAAFEPFKFYRDMGPTRSVSEAYRQKTGRKTAKMASGQWLAYYKKYRWTERAAEFDRYVAAIEAREDEKAFAERRRLWLGRRAVIQDDAWQLRAELLARARAILKLPLVRRVEKRVEADEGKTVNVTIIHEPLRVTQADAFRAVELGDKLGRLAADMATERIVTKSPAQEEAEAFADARAALRESAELFPDEPLSQRARNVSAAYGIPVERLLEGYDESAPLVTSANN